MTPAARLQTTLELLHDIDRVARPVDAVVSAFFRARRYLEEADRGRILDLVTALLRHHARLGWWLAKHGREDTPRNRLLAWLAMDGTRNREQIENLFSGKQFAPALLRDHERGLLGKLQGCTIEHPAMPDEVRYECPEWALEPLR